LLTLPNMAFTLPKLPYDFAALEPVIDAKTMEIHHDKHHAAYVEKLNAAVAGTEWENKKIEDILMNLGEVPDDKRMAVRNHGGGHWNHSFFWELLKKDAGEPGGKLAEAIEKDLGGMDKLKETFNAAAVNRFGSGWAWLGVRDGQLTVCSTPNQDNPLMKDIAELKECLCYPILGLDVWEHAYYILYQNRRAEYVEAFWQVVNWAKVSEHFEKVVA